MSSIIGIKFLLHYNLLVDAKRHKLLSAEHHVFISGIVTDSPFMSLLVVQKTSVYPYFSLLQKFP